MPNETPGVEIHDMLRHIFALQWELNDYVFERNGIKGVAAECLTMEAITQEAADGKLSVNDLPNQWIARYARALEEELGELKKDVLWKWWSQDVLDLQNVRVELVDILHFLISAMIAAGLTPEKVYDLYRQKHAVNVRRQDAGYSQATKDEADNKGIE